MCLNCVCAGKTFKTYKKKHTVYMVRKNFKPCQKLDRANDFNDCLYAEKRVTFLTVYKLKGKFTKKKFVLLQNSGLSIMQLLQTIVLDCVHLRESLGLFYA